MMPGSVWGKPLGGYKAPLVLMVTEGLWAVILILWLEAVFTKVPPRNLSKVWPRSETGRDRPIGHQV